MIPRTEFINLLREKGYSYKDQTDKSVLWRCKKNGHAVWLRRKEDPLSEVYVRSVLAQCGCAADEIERFIGQYGTH